MSTEAIVILCTAPADGDHAPRLARGLVDAQLAACVNLVPGVRSFYRWKGNVEDDAEIQMVIKTRPERFEEVAAWLNEHHPYDVPEILALPVTAGAEAYLRWVGEQTAADT